MLYNIIMVFDMHQHESTTGAHVSPIMKPPPTSLPTPSLWLSQSTGFECRASCIKLALVICFTYVNIHISLLFSPIIPPWPSPTETRSLFFTSVSLLLPCKQDHHCHLSKSCIYAFIYYIGVSLSDLLYSLS